MDTGVNGAGISGSAGNQAHQGTDAQPSLGGEVITDSFGNPDFYITVAGDTLATVAKVPGPARG